MNKSDTDFLAGLFKPVGEEEDKQKFVCVFRQGHLLTLLPMDRVHSLHALSLYQAQSFKARCYVLYLRCVLWLKAYFMVDIVELGKFKEPYQFLSSSQYVGFLLGNPNSDRRKMLAYHCEDDGAYVTKLALDAETSENVMKEMEDLETINQSLMGASSISGKSANDEKTHAYYTVPWVNGRAPKKVNEAALLELLITWIKSDDEQVLGNLASWKEIVSLTSATDDADAVVELGKKRVLEASIHGDFTPWNIKVNTDNEVSVLDWESYQSEGVSGIDWAHYLVQSKLLVGKLWPEEVIDILIYWAKSEDGASVLKKLGWGDDALSWIGCYLFYAHYKLGYNREELILCWKERVETSS